MLASVVYGNWYFHSSFLGNPGPNQSRHIQEIPSVSSCDHLCSIFWGLKYLLTKVHSSETKTWQQLSPLQYTLKETCYTCFGPPKSCVFVSLFVKAHVIGMAMPFVHVGVVCFTRTVDGHLGSSGTSWGCRYHCFCVKRRVLVGGIQGLTQTWGKRAKLATSSVLHGQVHLGVIKIGGWLVGLLVIHGGASAVTTYGVITVGDTHQPSPFSLLLGGGPASWGMHGAHDVLEVIY